MIRSRDYPWMSEVIELLSLDLTAHFTRELEIDHFYSEGLKRLARAVLPEIDGEDIFDEWTAQVAGQTGPFLRGISTALGRAAKTSLIQWMNRVYEGLPVGDLDEANLMLQYLVYKWDVNGENEHLPLCKPGEAHVRILIRDYVAHRNNVDTEVEYASKLLNSEWDCAVDKRHGVPGWSSSAVARMIGGDVAFWDRLAGMLASEQARELFNWMRRRSRSDMHCGKWDPPIALREAAEGRSGVSL